VPGATHTDVGILPDLYEQSCGIARLIQNNPSPVARGEMNLLLIAAFTGDRELIH